MVHDNPQQVCRLVKKLNGENINFIIHVDKSSKCDFSSLESYPNLQIVEPSVAVGWGKMGAVNSELLCCRQNIKSGVVVLLSGHDYPVKTNNYIFEYLKKNQDRDFVTAYSIPSKDNGLLEGGRRRLECYVIDLKPKEQATIEPRKFNIGNIRQLIKILIYNPLCLFKAFKIILFYKKRVHPQYLTPFGGEYWWVLRTETIKEILNFVDTHADFLEYHSHSAIPDEIVFPTIVWNLTPGTTINSCCRYINWHKGKSPKDLTLEDRDIINDCLVNPDYLFVRKISNSSTLDYIDNKI